VKLYQRVCLVLAHEGVSGVSRRIAHRLSGHDPASPRPATPPAGWREEHKRMAEEFYRRCAELGHSGVEKFWWYHTVDLGHGLVTPGVYDYRQTIAAFEFPEDMSGMRVLDVGSATGFFAFEFERRGADVTSVEVPSIADLDRFYGESPEQTLAKLRAMMEDANLDEQVNSIPGTAEEMYQNLVDGPFRFCHRTLGSKVKRHYSSIYDLSGETLGGSFDLVFLGDILLHTIEPVKALAAVAPLCRGRLIVAQDLPEGDGRPAMLYNGGDRSGDDTVHWWLPNRACMEQVLGKLGFREVAVVGEHQGLIQPHGLPFKRAIVQAAKSGA
jgi:SAM-dependent methyltransferase